MPGLTEPLHNPEHIALTYNNSVIISEADLTRAVVLNPS